MSTVYEESVRRLNLMITVIELKAIYSGLEPEVAKVMLHEYSNILRQLRLEYNYTGEDNLEYKARLMAEFVMKVNPYDLDYDPAHGPSSVSYTEATQLEAEHALILAKHGQPQSDGS